MGEFEKDVQELREMVNDVMKGLIEIEKNLEEIARIFKEIDEKIESKIR